MSQKATLQTDGGARGNPGPAGIGFVLSRPGQSVIKEGHYIGIATNNQAEYQALRAGLVKALELGVTEIECLLDSELVVRQLQGKYRVKNDNIKALFVEVESLVHRFTTIQFRHVPRESNKQADRLVNIAIDKNIEK